MGSLERNRGGALLARSALPLHYRISQIRRWLAADRNSRAFRPDDGRCTEECRVDPVRAALWIPSFAHWLNPRRLRAQAMLLAVCLWGVCAFDYSTPGLFDRAGNIKFQDFFQFPVSANLIAQGR